MEDLQQTLKELQQAVQTLLKKHNRLKKECEELKKGNEELRTLLIEKEKIINAAEEKIDANNLAGIYNIEERQLLQSRINTYLSDIEKCLTILNAK
jgi:hypothetical protein